MYLAPTLLSHLTRIVEESLDGRSLRDFAEILEPELFRYGLVDGNVVRVFDVGLCFPYELLQTPAHDPPPLEAPVQGNVHDVDSALR